MIQNEGEVDRLLRAVIGVILILAGINFENILWQAVFCALGGALVFTSFTGFCLICKIFDFSTKNKK